MKNVRRLMGVAALAAASCANAAGGWEQFHGTHNNGRAEKGPDLRRYATPRFARGVEGVNDMWGMDVCASGPVVMDGRIFCYGNSGCLSAFDESSGAKLWTARVADGSMSGSWASPSASNGRVYIGSGGFLYCFDAAAGATNWVCALTSASGIPEVVNAAPTVAEGIGLCYQYTCDFGGAARLHAVRIADGSLAWAQDVAGFGEGHVAYNPSLSLIYTTTDTGGGRIVALDAADGSAVWTSAGSFGVRCYGGVAFDAALGWVAAASDTGGGGSFGTLLVCDAADGSTVSRTAHLPSGNFTPAIGANGVIYGCGGDWSMDGPFVWAVNGLTGAMLWQSPEDEDYEMGCWGNWNASPVYAQDIGGGADAVYCTASGMWASFILGGEAFGMFDAATGGLLASVPMCGGNAALANGNLYFINWDSELVAFGPQVHIVEAAHNGHGHISPSLRQGVAHGGDAAFTFTGIVADVLVDGLSIGATNAYTFANVQGSHTLSVVFTDPATLGYAAWLGHYGLTPSDTLYDRWLIGLHPASDATLTAFIAMRDGAPEITWAPDIRPLRKYTIRAKENLDGPGDWTDIEAPYAIPPNFRFFRVRVTELP